MKTPLLRLLAAGTLTAAPLTLAADNPARLDPVQTTTLSAEGFPYALFETTIDHADLAGCPDGIDSATRFCRLTLAGDMAHVFVFALDGAQPLLAVHSFDLSGQLLPF